MLLSLAALYLCRFDLGFPIRFVSSCCFVSVAAGITLVLLLVVVAVVVAAVVAVVVVAATAATTATTTTTDWKNGHSKLLNIET